MGEHVTLKTLDGHTLDAYVARPQGDPIAGLVVVQEIFGVNPHIRSVADGYAKDGFLAIAPALFDRIQPGVELKYEGDDAKTGRELAQKLVPDLSLNDIAAASDFVCSSTGKKVGIIGYCYGGTLAWLAAARLHPEAAVGYYGGQIAKHIDEELVCPVMLHFGKQDNHIPASDVEKIQAAHPEVEVYWYDAGHGFNCDARASYNAAAAKEARERSLDFLKKHLA